MNVKQYIRMTASEIALGRYMRAPDHPPADDEFAAAFDAETLKAAGTGGGDGAVVVDDGAAAAAPAAGAGGDGAAAPAGDGAGAAAGGEGEAAAAAAAPSDDAVEAGAAKTGEAGAEGAAGGAEDGAAGGDAGAATPAAAAGEEVDADKIIDKLASALASRTPAKEEVAAPAEVAAEEKPLFTEAEQASLAKFREDWPAEYEAMNLMQRELGTGIIQYVFEQIAPAVREVKELAETLALRASHGDVTTDLGEYPSDEEIDQISEWVKTQPSYLQPGMNGVIESGTSDEVVDLVTRYRKETGKQPATVQEDKPAPSGGETELSGAAKQAAAALAPVGSKRSVVQDPEDASSFDDGWARFKDMKV